MTLIKICYGKISCWDKCFLQLIFIINLHLFWRHLISYFFIVSLFHLIHIKICYGEINLSLKILVFFSSSASVYCLILFFCWLILFFLQPSLIYLLARFLSSSLITFFYYFISLIQQPQFLFYCLISSFIILFPRYTSVTKLLEGSLKVIAMDENELSISRLIGK